MTTSLTREQGLELLRQMLRIRRFEERAAELYQSGKIHGFLHLYIGEEAVAAGSIPALTNDDAIVATYREHGHALVRGTPMKSLMAELYGKATGCARGRALLRCHAPILRRPGDCGGRIACGNRLGARR
jgi:TPP-dependent pyruvate/acetoin dehydrogenase alpha subunit